MIDCKVTIFGHFDSRILNFETPKISKNSWGWKDLKGAEASTGNILGELIHLLDHNGYTAQMM